jgi:cobyrinic acid a,c-diamide synthase
MVLGESLEDAEGTTHRMAGLLPVATLTDEALAGRAEGARSEERGDPVAEVQAPPRVGRRQPGGYPELHAGRIAAASRFLDGLHTFAGTRPVHGECVPREPAPRSVAIR